MQALEEFEQWVLPASMGTPHPLYLGLVNCSPLPAAALADLLSPLSTTMAAPITSRPP